MRLSELLKDIAIYQPPSSTGASEVNITQITLDSRECKPNSLFAALHGDKTDGRDYIENAIQQGAAAILLSDDTNIKESWKKLCIIPSPHPRKTLGLIAKRFYEHSPYSGQPEHIAAVTGTNGKTSVAHFCRQLWNLLGHKSASIGTLGVMEKEGTSDLAMASLTTPNVVELHRIMAELKKRDTAYVAIEASSHGLDQERTAGVTLSVGAITNLSRDHLDYHGTEQAYFEAKLKLFGDTMPEKRVAVLNSGMTQYAVLEQTCQQRQHRIISYGSCPEDDICLEKAEYNTKGQRLNLRIFGNTHTVSLPLIGGFQGENVLCAMGIIMGMGEDNIERILRACEQLEPVPGRMEQIAQHPRNSTIIVDYAHTPDALEKALSALRPHTKGKLSVLFGCGGDRDKGKRGLMGEVACRLADAVIVTDDNPRHEDPGIIRAEIMLKCLSAHEIDGREGAIHYAISQLGPDDVLLIAGKGHETTQTIGDKAVPFDDREKARIACEEIHGR